MNIELQNLDVGGNPWYEIGATVDGAPAGLLEWAERPGGTYEMHLDVEPQHHRKGVGRAMYDKLEDIVKRRDGMSIYSFCAWDNAKARRFFAAMGFQETYAPGFYGTDRGAWLLWKTVGAPK